MITYYAEMRIWHTEQNVNKQDIPYDMRWIDSVHEINPRDTCICTNSSMCLRIWHAKI